MTRGWTGGQFSLLRVALAALAFIQLASDLAAAWPAIALAGVVCAACAAGIASRATALFVAVSLLGAAAGRELAASRTIWEASSGAVGLALVLALVAWLVPPAPYGSLEARGRVDPAGSWRMPPRLIRLASLALAAGLTFGGALTWRNANSPWEAPLAAGALLAAALIVIPRGRSLGWAIAGVAMLFAALVPGDPFSRVQPALLGVWLIGFEPRWFPPRAPEGLTRLFYDGECGLCHGSVRLLLAEEAGAESGRSLRFAPLHGPSFEESIPPERRGELPDSIVLIDADGSLATRSRAVVRLGRRLGGVWRLLATALSLLPRPLADAGYDLIAAVRLRLAPRPSETCPLLPPRLRARFDP